MIYELAGIITAMHWWIFCYTTSFTNCQKFYFNSFNGFDYKSNTLELFISCSRGVFSYLIFKLFNNADGFLLV